MCEVEDWKNFAYLGFCVCRECEARPVWKPMHKQPCYKNVPAYVNGVSEAIFKVGMCLPAGPYVTDEDVRYILYTTSVNDQGRMLSPVIFKKFLYTYAELAKEKNKYLFFHTYMNVPHEHIKTVPYKNTDYDNVLQEIASIYANVFYIDMSNFNDDRFVLKDKTHFNTLFHETLKAKYLDYVYDINKNMYWIDSPYDQINDKNSIIVTGDSYAGAFYLYEHEKKYNMAELAMPNRTIIENEHLINNSLMSTSKYVLLSTSVNDFREKTDLNRFEDELRRFANLATTNSKILFLHTYMNYVYYEDKTASQSETEKRSTNKTRNNQPSK